MTAPITSSPTTTTSSTSTSSTTSNSDPLAAVAGGTLDKNAFMQLLVAQMNNQDPLNPADSTEMATQLAQFSSVEQLMNINQTLSAQGSASSALVDAVNNSAAIGLLGKTVTAQSSQIAVGTNGTSSVSTNVTGAGGDLKVSITNASGVTVASKDLGSVNAGTQSVSLGSLTSGLANGTYTVNFTLTDSTGAVTNPPAMVTAKIDGIQFGTNGAVVTSGPLSFPISAISSVNSSN